MYLHLHWKLALHNISMNGKIHADKLGFSSFLKPQGMNIYLSDYFRDPIYSGKFVDVDQKGLFGLVKIEALE